jgi:fatty acid desaturase/SAM-dependent methyltransferase
MTGLSITESTCPACGARGANGALSVHDHEYGLPGMTVYAVCSACHTCFQAPMPNDAQLASFYPPDYHSMDRRGLLTRIRYDVRIRGLLGLLDGRQGPLLDHGCGDGSFLLRAAERMPNRRLFGYEISSRRTVENLAGGQITIVRGSLSDLLDVLPGCALISMNHVIEHLRDPLAILSTLHERLLARGIFEGQTPAAASLEQRVFGVRWSGYHAPRHTVVFSRTGLCALLQRAGFVDTDVQAAFNPAGIAISLASLTQPANAPGRVKRSGPSWLVWLGLSAALAPLDLCSGAPGIMNFSCKAGIGMKIGVIDPAFVRRSDWQSAMVALAHIALTYLPVYLAAASGASALLVVYWLWFGLLQNGLINMMHECAHKLMFRRPWLNEALGGAVLAPRVVTDFGSYCRRHWDHHRQLGTAADPKVVYHTSIRKPRLWALVVRCAVGLEAFQRLTERPSESLHADDDDAKSTGLSLRLVATQAVFSGSVLAIAWIAHPGDWRASLRAAACAYFGVYCYGLLSVTVFAAALRAIAEHQIGTDGASTEGTAALRNLRCNALTRMVFGAYGFGEHATHHHRPGVPYYHLPALTREMAATDPAFVAHRGYLGTLALLVKCAPPTESRSFEVR